MKYIIMCGGRYQQWQTPRQLIKIRGEPIVARTIRLLRENGIADIAISSNDPVFQQAPTCYIFGDVVFSPEAINKIVETQTDDIMFFGSAPPFASEYIKRWAEPFALKVADTNHLKQAIKDLKRFDTEGRFNRKPIMWELWQVIKGGDLNRIDYRSYIAINDYTCDIDYPDEARLFEKVIP